MSLNYLSEKEREIIRQCLRATAEGPFFPDWEFTTLFGVERQVVSNVLHNWPNIDEESEETQLAINNSMVNLLGYPHQCEDEWSKYISVSPQEVSQLFAKWRGGYLFDSF